MCFTRYDGVWDLKKGTPFLRFPLCPLARHIVAQSGIFLSTPTKMAVFFIDVRGVLSYLTVCIVVTIAHCSSIVMGIARIGHSPC